MALHGHRVPAILFQSYAISANGGSMTEEPPDLAVGELEEQRSYLLADYELLPMRSCYVVYVRSAKPFVSCF